MNILEGCRHNRVEHLVYASSSSVYGATETMPFSVQDNVDHPVSLYAASKKANELMAHTYSHLYQLPTTGLRFYRLWSLGAAGYGAVYLHPQDPGGEPIDVFNFGHHKRDFTYIDDIVEGVVRTLDHVAQPNPTGAACTRTPPAVRGRTGFTTSAATTRQSCPGLSKSSRKRPARPPKRTTCQCSLAMFRDLRRCRLTDCRRRL